MSGRKSYASLFGIRAVSLCFSFCLFCLFCLSRSLRFVGLFCFVLFPSGYVRVLDSTGGLVRIRRFVLPKRRLEQCSRFAGGQEAGLSLGRIDPTTSRPTESRPAPPPRRAPPRPDRSVVCPGFGFDRFLRFVQATCLRCLRVRERLVS